MDSKAELNLCDHHQGELFSLQLNQAISARNSGCITVSWQQGVTFAFWFALARGRLVSVVASRGKTVLLQPLVLHGIFCTAKKKIPMRDITVCIKQICR